MAEVRPYTSLQGILIPHYLLTGADVVASSEGGPIPGVPTANTANDGDMALEVIAATAQDSTTRNLRIQRGGNPSGAEFAWKQNSDAGSRWRGWDAPTVIHHCEALFDDAAPQIPWGYDLARTSRGNLIGIAKLAGLADLDWRPISYAAGTWTESASILSATILLGTEMCAAVCPLPDGRVLAFIPRALTAGATYIQVDAWLCPDPDTAPGTWEQWAADVLPQALDTAAEGTYGRMRAAYSSGSIVLVLDRTETTGERVIRQWASSDSGASFREIEDWITALPYEGWRPDLAVLPDGRIVMGFLQDDGTPDGVCLLVIARCSDPFSQGVLLENFITPGNVDLSIAVDEAGERLIVVANAGVLIPSQLLVRYYDLDNLSGDPRHWLSGLDGGNGNVTLGSYFDFGAGSYGSGLVCRFADGSLHGIGHVTSRTVDSQNQWLTAFRAGGWHDAVLPRWWAAAYPSGGRIGWGRIIPGVGVDLLDSTICTAADDGAGATLHPDGRGWTLTNTGAGSDLPSGSWEWDFSGGAGQGRYHRDFAGTVGGGMVVGFEVQAVSGGDIAASNIVAEITVADGVTETTVVIRLGTNSIRIYDQIAGATIDTVNVDVTVWTHFLVAVAKEEVRVWVWRPGESYYRAAGGGATTFTAVGPAGSSRLMWGQPVNSTAKSRWRWVAACAGTDDARIGQALCDQGNPDSTDPQLALPGRILPAVSGAFIEGTLHVRGTRGPASIADIFNLAPAYQYPASALDPRTEASPRRGWRSTDDGTEQTLSWVLVAAEPMGPSIGIILLRPNFATAYWEGYTGGAYATIATLDLRVASGLDYARSGNLIVPDGATPGSTRYIARNELVGGYAILDAGADVRPIIANTEGVWGVSSTRKTCSIIISSDTTEPASGADLGIIGPVYGAVLHEQSAAYSRYRLRVASTICYENVHLLGTLCVGNIGVFGRQTARGRVVATTHGTTVSRAASRVSSARVDGPPQRIATLQPGVSDLTGLAGTAPTPDYLTGSNAGLAVGTWQDVAMLLEGIQRETDGPAVPVVYLPRIPRGAGLQALRGYEDVIYGRVESGVSRSAELGYENTSEVVATDSITIVEEP